MVKISATKTLKKLVKVKAVSPTKVLKTFGNVPLVKKGNSEYMKKEVEEELSWLS